MNEWSKKFSKLFIKIPLVSSSIMTCLLFNMLRKFAQRLQNIPYKEQNLAPDISATCCDACQFPKVHLVMSEEVFYDIKNERTCDILGQQAANMQG